MRKLHVAAMIAVASAIAIATTIERGVAAGPGTTQNSPQVKLIDLPLKLPAVGNIDGVRQWRFGRIQMVEQSGATQPDIGLEIRDASGSVLRIIAPGPPLAELARRSNWLASPEKARPSRADYAERMIAFDVDENGRLIALMSLEPVNRSRRNLERALGN